MKSQLKGVMLFAVIAMSVGVMKCQTGDQANNSPANREHYSISLLLRMENSFLTVQNTSYRQTADTIQEAKPKPKLLPDNMGIMEKALWGEHGFMRFTGISSLTPSSRKNELTFRRTLLSLHQASGFATLGLLAATLVYGQKNINMRNAAIEGRATFDQNLADTHRTLGIVTFSAYMTTAALAIFSPPPLIRRNEWSTISTHKTLAIFHFAGMVATPILAYLAYHANSIEEEKRFQKAHQITAYATAAIFTASMLIVTF